jgi:ketosteroid isomerase-like protein
MKLLIKLFILISIFTQMNALAQSKVETEILHLSLDKFRWKTEGKIDLVEDLFDDELVFIHITGHTTTKAEWIKQLKSGSFVYNKIEQKEAAVKVYGDTAVLVGKAYFTVNGGSLYKLVYTEVYTKKNEKWKLVNLHTTSGNF